MKTNWLDKYLEGLEKPARAMMAEIAMVSSFSVANSDSNAVCSDEQRVETIWNIITTASNGLVVAGKIFCDMVDARTDAYEFAMRINPRLSFSFLSRLERLGRGKLNQELIWFGDSPIVTRIASLSAAKQEEILNHKLPVAIAGGRVEHKSLQEMTNTERLRVIGKDGVKKPDEQLPKKKAMQSRWEIKGSQVFFNQRGPFSLKEIEAIHSNLKANALSNLNSHMNKNQISK